MKTPFVRQILDKSLVAYEFYERTAKWLDDYERSNMVNPKAVYDLSLIHISP